MISYVILGAFIFVPLLLCSSSVSSDLKSRARKRKNFAHTKFVWPVDKVINNNLLVQIGLLWAWYAAVCKSVRYRFLFSLWFPVCFPLLKLRMHEILQSQSAVPPTKQATYLPYLKVTLLHIFSSNIIIRVGNIVGVFLWNPQCHGNFPFDINIGINATGVLVINSNALNDRESHPIFILLNYNA